MRVVRDTLLQSVSDQAWPPYSVIELLVILQWVRVRLASSAFASAILREKKDKKKKEKTKKSTAGILVSAETGI